MSPDQVSGQNVTDNPFTLETSWVYRMRITVPIPSSVSLGSHSYHVWVDGLDSTNTTFTWNSTQATLQVVDPFQMDNPIPLSTSLDVVPRTTAVGYATQMVMWLGPQSTANSTSGGRLNGMQIVVMTPDGRELTWGPLMTDWAGNCITLFTPDLTGEYSAYMYFPGQVLNEVAYGNATSNTVHFTVTKEPIEPSPTPTPSPTAQPTIQPTAKPTAQPTAKPTARPKTESSLDISCKSSTTSSNFKVDIIGHLSAGDLDLADKPVLLSYSVDGGQSWGPLTLLTTDDPGEFSAVWTPPVTGKY